MKISRTSMIIMFSAALLLVSFDVFTVNAGMKSSSGTSSLNIVETAMKAGNFNTLTKALRVAELSETLKGDGPFTVFAPTDEAFRKLPPGALNELLKDKDKLAAVLTYHVVPGSVTS